MVKDSFLGNVLVKILSRQECNPRIWLLDSHLGTIFLHLFSSNFYFFSLAIEVDYLPGFQRSGAIVQNALLVDRVQPVVAVES